MIARHAFAPAALALGLALGACGDGGDSTATGMGGDEAAIRHAIEVFGTTSDPDNCTALATRRYLEQTEFEKGEGAVASCRAATGADTDADSVGISGIQISDGKATAEVAYHGGGFDGQSVAVSLVNQDGTWKLDHIDHFTSFDRDKFLASFESAATAGGSSSTAKQARCLSEALRPLSDKELEALFLSGDPNRFVKYLAPCLR